MQIHQFFQTLGSYRILKDLRIPFQERDSSLVIDHPTIANAHVWIKDHNCVSDSDLDRVFVAGNIYDLLALFMGGYDKMVDYMLHVHLDCAVRQEGQLPDAHRTALIDNLVQTRLIFQHWLEVRDNLRTDTVGHRDYLNWLSKKNLSIEVADLAFAATGAAMNRWLGSYDSWKTLHASNKFVVLPFFSDPHTLARVEMHDIDSDKVHSFDLQNVSCSFLGLHTIRPGCSDVRTRGQLWEMIEYYTKSRDHGDSRFGCIYPHFSNVQSNVPVLHFPYGVFVYKTQPDFGRAARCKSLFDNYQMQEESSINSEEWRRFAISSFRQLLLQENGMTFRVQSLVDDLAYDTEVTFRIANSLRACGDTALAQQVERHLANNQEYAYATFTIRETKHGYYYRKSGTDKEMPATDFILKIKHSCSFDSSNDVFHYGHLIMSGEEVPITISHTDIGNPTKLLRVVSIAASKFRKGEFMLTPTMEPGPSRAAVAHHIMKSPQTRLQGLDRLGWDRERQKFETSEWYVDVNGVHRSLRLPHPSNLICQQYYNFGPSKLIADSGLVTSEIRSVVARVVSMLVRNFYSLPFPLMTFRNDVNGIECLSSIFRAFGQLNSILLNLNTRDSVKLLPAEVENFPVLGESGTDTLLQGRTMYVMALTPDGELITSECSEDRFEDRFEQVYSMCSNIFSQVALSLVRRGGEIGRLLNDKPVKMIDYVREGQHLVESLTEYKTFPVLVEAIPYFRTMLSKIPIEHLHRFFSHDKENGTVCIKFRDIKTVLRKDVQAELVKLNPAVINTRYTDITANADFIIGLLEAYYNCKIQLPIKSSEDRSETPLQAPPAAGADSVELSPTSAPATAHLQ